MKRIFVACAILVCAASVRAQSESAPPVESAPPSAVVLCEASWMDAERVRALLAVEFGPHTPALQVDVHNCSVVAADVRVRFGNDADARERTNHLDLSQTATGARSRLVALVIAELVRLGAPARVSEVQPTTEEPASEEPASEEPASEEPASEALTGDTRAEPPLEETPAEPVVSDAETSDSTDEPLIDAEATADTNESGATPAESDSSTGARCEGWSRFGRGPCSWAISLGFGVAFHQLGVLREPRIGSLNLYQLRLTGRWRYLFVGVRVVGAGFQTDRGGHAGGASALFGVEWWARRWSKHVLAFRTGIEAGVQGFRGFSNGGTDTCEFDCGSFGEPSFGGFTSVRYERAFGIIRGALELELGWSSGFRIDQSAQLVTGLGGPWLSFNIDLSIGRAE